MLFDLGLAQAFEVLHDVGPFEAVPGGGEAILEFLAQDESEERTEDVAAACGGRTWRPSFQPPRSLTVIAAKLQPKTIDLWHYVNAKF